MRNLIENYFGLKALNTSIRTEIIAGLTTFMTMAYIIFVNPAMISQTGMNFGAAMVATCIAAAFATLIGDFVVVLIPDCIHNQIQGRKCLL